jgi:integrase
MARRRFQRGCLRQEGERWTLRYREDVVLDSGAIERRLVNRTVGLVADLPTQRAARRAADALLQKINSTAYRPGVVITFAAFADRWRSTALPALKPTTQRVAEGQLRNYLIPALGSLPLERITPEIVQGMIVQLRGKVRRHTILNILGTLSSIISTARKWGYVTVEVSRKSLTIPRDAQPRHRPRFTDAQARAIITAAAEPWRTLFAVFAVTGMRGAEVLALQIDDLDFEGQRIFVRRTTQNGVMQLPKTATSTRTLPMPEGLAWVLGEYLAKHHRPNPQGLLFCSSEGKPLWLDHVRERRLWPILDQFGIPRCGFHAFRRGCGTLLASIGAPVKVAQGHLGHSDPRVTLEIYTQVVDEDHRKAAASLDRVLLPSCYLEGHNAVN